MALCADMFEQHLEYYLDGTDPNLERQGARTLFPNNPELYERTSGLYGPGSIVAWHFLLISAFLNWRSQRRTRGRALAMSADLVAAMVYPVFAATHLLIQAIKIMGIEDRAEALNCLIQFNYPPVLNLNLTNIPPEIITVNQRLLAINGPLAVSHAFSFLFLFLILFFLPVRLDFCSPVTWLCGSWVYVSLVVVFFYCSLADSVSYATRVAFLWLAITFFKYFILIGFAICGTLAAYVFRRVKVEAVELMQARNGERLQGLKTILGRYSWPAPVGVTLLLVVFGLVPAYFSAGLLLIVPLFPDLGISLRESDQLAAVIGGSMALVYTIYSVFWGKTEDQGQTERALEDGDTPYRDDPTSQDIPAQDTEDGIELRDMPLNSHHEGTGLGDTPARNRRNSI